jgi:hypothetical protein
MTESSLSGAASQSFVPKLKTLPSRFQGGQAQFSTHTYSSDVCFDTKDGPAELVLDTLQLILIFQRDISARFPLSKAQSHIPRPV